MKKNFLLATMALFMTLFASSCSQEEIISDNNSKEGGTVSVAVNIPVNNPVTRAVPNIPEGYKLRCILQLVNSSGNDIENGRYVEEAISGSDRVTFTFNAPTESYKCLFWADYVKAGGNTDISKADNLYNTQDLKNITYTQNAGSEMFNNDAADAFFGKALEPATSGELSAVTLTRPFTKITFSDTKQGYTDYTKITVTNLPAPTGFNVLTGAATGNAGKGDQAIISSSEDLAIENNKWFSVYLFTNANDAKLGKDNNIEFTLKKADGTKAELSFKGENIPLTPNQEVNATVDPESKGNTTIDVIFPDWNDPSKPKVGQFLYKDGTWGDDFNKDNTIGIVFATKNSSIIDESNYGDSYTGKEIVGYAMAITSVSKKSTGEGTSTNFIVVKEYSNEAWITGDYNGYKYTNENYITKMDQQLDFYKEWEKWTTAYSIPTNIKNLSSWYIPSARQLLDIIGLTWGYNGDAELEIAAITKDNTFANAYSKVIEEGNGGANFVNDVNGTTTEANMVSSYVTSTAGSVAGFNKLNTTTQSFTKMFDVPARNSVTTRPVLTIFKAE